MATIRTQGLDLATALRRLNAERLQADREPELVFGPEFRLVAQTATCTSRFSCASTNEVEC